MFQLMQDLITTRPRHAPPPSLVFHNKRKKYRNCIFFHVSGNIPKSHGHATSLEHTIWSFLFQVWHVQEIVFVSMGGRCEDDLMQSSNENVTTTHDVTQSLIVVKAIVTFWCWGNGYMIQFDTTTARQQCILVCQAGMEYEAYEIVY